jgi:hypothetical protein
MPQVKRYIGYFGHPPRDVLDELTKKYPGHDWIDLDVDIGSADSGAIPFNYCRIIRNIIDNALAMKSSLDTIIASTGADKCEGGRYAAYLLKQHGINVIETRNDSITSCDNPGKIHVPISTSSLPLVEKVDRIMKTVLYQDPGGFSSVNPTHGFWGVPPHDFEILKLFPDSTHVYGWTRTVEAQRPADINLECYVDFGIPTVFYTQSFCAKSQLAKYLAEKHGGLFVDADGKIGMGIKSRIEAFLELNS